MQAAASPTCAGDQSDPNPARGVREDGTGKGAVRARVEAGELRPEFRDAAQYHRFTLHCFNPCEAGMGYTAQSVSDPGRDGRDPGSRATAAPLFCKIN